MQLRGCLRRSDPRRDGVGSRRDILGEPAAGPAIGPSRRLLPETAPAVLGSRARDRARGGNRLAASRGSPGTHVVSAPVADKPAATWAAGELRAPGFSLVDQLGAPVARVVSRPRGHRHLHRSALSRLLPARGEHLNDVVRGFPAGSRPRSSPSASTSTATRARTCCRTRANGSSSRSGAGVSAARRSSRGSGRAYHMVCSQRRRKSPACRCTRSCIPRPRTSSTRAGYQRASSSGRTAPAALRARYGLVVVVARAAA